MIQIKNRYNNDRMSELFSDYSKRVDNKHFLAAWVPLPGLRGRGGSHPPQPPSQGPGLRGPAARKCCYQLFLSNRENNSLFYI